MERHKIEPHKKTIFTNQFFIDLAKECGLNTAIFEQLGSGRDTEIVVDNDILEMLVKLQEQFARLEEMGDQRIQRILYRIAPPYSGRMGRLRSIDCRRRI